MRRKPRIVPHIERIEQLMNQLDLNSSGLAITLGVSRACVSRLLNGRRRVSSEVVAAFWISFPNYEKDYFFYTDCN
ncbi:DNA-binding protein [Sporomusaceae bacterium FL31]|nr:DNA-binding protein [Sporomusaceae bacterium FL31]GCE33693.1 DNA-binding protein [Sporomusaceae bacterium]